MKFSTALIATGVLATSAFAAPAPATQNKGGDKFVTYWKNKFGQFIKGNPKNCPAVPKPEKCMTDDEADEVARYFQDLIRGYTIEQALAGLTEDFVDYSSSVSIIINKGAGEPNNINDPIFTSREQFMAGHGKQEPIPFVTDKVWHNCNGTVSMRWHTTRSAQGKPTEAGAIIAPGLVILETIPAEEGNTYPYRIHTIYSEFNAAAWLVNLGIFKPEGPVTPVPQDAKLIKRGIDGGALNVDALGIPRDEAGRML